MHSMSFHGGVEEIILFRSWKINNIEGIISSIIGVILLAALYEGLKCYRDYLFARMRFVKRHTQQKESGSESLFSGVHFYQTFLHVIQIVVGYFLMFIFMTFNYWLCIAVGIGTALGYWLFAWERFSHQNMDCCS